MTHVVIRLCLGWAAFGVLTAACSASATTTPRAVESPAVETPIPKPTVTLASTAGPTPQTEGPVAERTATPTGPPPRVTASPSSHEAKVDWASLPRLADVLLTAEDAKNSHQSRIEGFVLQRSATDELQGHCLLDCAKMVLSDSSGTVTIVALRARSTEDARAAAAQLRRDFLGCPGYEYTMDNADFWRDIPADTWIIARTCPPRFDTSVGTYSGPVVLLIVYSYDLCFFAEGQQMCEGDIAFESQTAVRFMNLQLAKLRESGYP